MPDEISDQPDAARESRIQSATVQARIAEGAGVFWMLALAGVILLGLGWLLPWFVNPFSGGVGFSPQDALVSAPTGVASLMIYLLAAIMVVTVAWIGYDGVCVLHRRTPTRGRHIGLAGSPYRALRLRAAVASGGFLITLALWLLIRIENEEPLLGRINNHTITDSAVWLTMVGYVMLALILGRRNWILHHSGIAFAGIAFTLGGLFPLIFHQSVDFIGWGARFLAVYTLLALGLNVVVGFAGLLDLGYAAFFAIGAYTCASLASPRHDIHLPFWIILFIGAAVATCFGAVLGAPTLRLRGDYLAIVTLGFGEIIPDLARNDVFRLTGGPNGISSIDSAHIFGLDFGNEARWYFWSLLVLIAFVILTFRNLERSRVGRAWVALREDEIAAAATGINTTTTKLLAFAIGASVSGLAGAFYGAMVSVVTPEDFSFSVSVAVLSMVVLGGIGNIKGVAAGALVLTFVIFWALPNMQEWMTTAGHTTGLTALGRVDYIQYTYVVYGIALIVMMLLRPGGLIPSRARRIELETGVESQSLAAVQGRA